MSVLPPANDAPYELHRLTKTDMRQSGSVRALEDLGRICRASSWSLAQVLIDPDQLFSVFLLEAG
jgi:hypothetical protein